MKVTALIVAGGMGKRMGEGKNKVFLPLSGKTVIEHTLNAFFLAGSVEEIVIVTRKEDISECERLFSSAKKNVKVVEGGSTRQESVYNGLKGIDDGIVLIHDAARALIEADIVEQCVEACGKYGASAVGVTCVDTLKRVDENGFIIETIPREGVYRIQTPQTFKVKDIKYAHEKALEENFETTDDCALYEKYMGKIKIVEGTSENIKITFPEDLVLASTILKKKKETK